MVSKYEAPLNTISLETFHALQSMQDSGLEAAGASVERYASDEARDTSPEEVRDIRSAALMGIGFSGRFDDVMAIMRDEGFQSAVSTSAGRMVDADSMEGLIFPTLPLRIEAAQAMTATECRQFVKDYVNRYNACLDCDDFSSFHEENERITHAVSTGDESVGYIIPVIVAFHQEPARMPEGASFGARAIFEQMIETVQLNLESQGVWSFNQGRKELPDLQVVAFDHFIPACRNGMEAAMKAQVARVEALVHEIAERAERTIEKVSISGNHLDIDLGGSNLIGFTASWLKDEHVLHTLNERVCQDLSGEVEVDRHLHDVHHTKMDMRGLMATIN